MDFGIDSGKYLNGKTILGESEIDILLE